MGVRNFLTFFRLTTGGQTAQPILTQNGSNDVHSRKDVPFAVKIATFHTPCSPDPLKGQNFTNFWPLTLEAQRVNTPYSSSDPSESDIMNRQSGGEKLKYVLKFYPGGTHHVISRMRNHDLALCQWADDVWGGISRKPLEIETWVQRTTNRKWPIPSPMVTWPMTSRDLKGQGRDPNILRARYLGNGWR